MKRVMYNVLLLFIMLGLAGCQGADEVKDENIYKIYYLNSSMTKLVSQDYMTETIDQDQLIQEFLEQILTVPKELDNQVALSDKVALQNYRKEDMVLYLYFDAGYSSSSNMKATREILCRGAFAKTMTQIPGIDYINIYVGEQPLLDREGNPVGMLAGSDFIESVSDVNSFEKTELVLFFTDETGEKLIGERREVIHNINTSLEKLIIEQLILGPEEEGLYPTIPKETKLLNVSVTESVCYINFDAVFSNSVLEVKDYVPIYSIVNSLSELSTVNKVQIMINGSQDVLFRDTFTLDTLFERDLDIGGSDD